MEKPPNYITLQTEGSRTQSTKFFSKPAGRKGRSRTFLRYSSSLLWQEKIHLQ